MQPKKLYFIASYPRSGNTWVRTFLIMLIKRTGVLSSEVTVEKLLNFSPWDVYRSFIEQVLGKSIDNATVEEIIGARLAVHRHLADSLPTRILKTHSVLGGIFGFDTFSPDTLGGATYIVRNPLDVAPSLARQLHVPVNEAIKIMSTPNFVFPSNEAVGAEPWAGWSRNVNSWTGMNNAAVLVVRYEDLLSDPRVAFAKIVAHLRLEASPEQIDAATNDATLENLERLEAEGIFRNEAPANPKVFGSGARRSYRDKLTPGEARSIIQRHNKQMQRFGYLDDEAIGFAGLSPADVQAMAAAGPGGR